MLRLLRIHLRTEIRVPGFLSGLSLALLALSSAVAPVGAASVYKVGNFGKSQASAPATQVVTHNLGEVPKAVIIWTAGGTTIDFNLSVGFYDGTTQRSVSASSQDKRSFGGTSSHLTNKAITMGEYDGTVVAEADIIAMDATTLTLNWTTNDGASTSMHYMVIGGSDIQARVVEWIAPASTGLTPVNGVGFEPDLVFHAFSRLSAADPQGIIGFGAMDGAGNEWANSVYSANGVADTDTQRGQTTGACLHAIDTDLTVLRQASFVSMDPDGFTVNVTSAPAWTNNVVSLALTGLQARVGSFAKNAGASQAISGVGFQPDLVLFSSFQEAAQASPVPQSYLGFGASDGSTEGASTITDTDALPQTDVHSRDTGSRALVVSNNLNGFVDSDADLTALTGDGFTLGWATNDGAPTEILYLALGESVPGAASISGQVFEDADFAGTASAYDGGVGDAVLPNVDVELYAAADSGFIATTATDGSGQYSFSGLTDGTYLVRARSATVGDADTPPAGGLNPTVPGTWPYPLSEMTWGNGSAVYGGQDAMVNDTDTADDGGPGDTYVSVAVSGADVPEVNLGFAYNLIVNTADDVNTDDTRSRQGSLRQYIKNANAITNGTAADTSQFRILGAGPHTVQPVRALPVIADAVHLDATTEPDYAGNPIVEIEGSLAGTTDCFSLASGSTGSSIRGFVINRFDGHAIRVFTNDNTIASSYLGTDVTGMLDQGNTGSGIYITSSNNAIGGSTPGAGNVISGNAGYGIKCAGASTSGNTIQGNLIGLDVSGTGALANDEAAVEFSDASNNVLGGTDPGARNVIASVFGKNGVRVISAAAAGNKILGNYFGTNASGNAPLSGGTGCIYILNGVQTEIGGTDPGAGNVIGGYSQYGISTNGQWTTIEGNFVGTDTSGTLDLTTGQTGILIGSGGTGIRIGGAIDEAANIVAYNTNNGIHLTVNAGSGNQIRRNSIHSNGQLGIDLGGDGVTPNDLDDPDPGANSLQNYPVLTSFSSGGGNTTISGTFNSTANSTFEIDFYSNTTMDLTEFGEGETHLGSETLITDGSGNATINAVLPVTVGSDQAVSATATDASGSTSEFSKIIKPSSGLAIIKRAYLPDGTPVADGATLPLGTIVKFLLYVNNDGSARSDVSVRDVLDSTFAYIPGTLKVDNAAANCAGGACTEAEEETIFSIVDGATPGSDQVDGDVVSFDGSTTIDAGARFAGNGRLDIAGSKVWALLFAVKISG